MSLRRKFISYLIVVHLLFATLAVLLLLQNRLWLLFVEFLFACSLAGGIRLVYLLFGTIDLIRTGAQFLNESDFTARFREVGQVEMDQLVRVYNRMADHLREERVRLQEQHYFLEKIIQASPSGVITLDYDGRIAMVNPSASRLLQSPAQELIGRRPRDISSPLGRTLDELQTGESRLVLVGGRRRVKCRKSHFLDRGFSRDFLLLEELTEELRQFEKAAYEKLIRMMSHEVNNSIGSANSLLHSCLNYKDQLNPDDRKDFESALEVVIARTEQLNGFMRRFAEVARLPAPIRTPCDVQRLLLDMTHLMRSESQRRNVQWIWDIREVLAPISMDRNQMGQVFLNILKNALEAIGENGTITLHMGRRNGRPFVAVEDTGSGISPEVQSQIFTPFFSTKKNGQGLGLTLIQEILDQHQFEFSLDSRAGSPTEFVILF